MTWIGQRYKDWWACRPWKVSTLPVRLSADRFLVTVSPAFVASAVTLCTKYTAAFYIDHSDEWKRHQVYAALIKQFPTAAKRDLAMAIELAVHQGD